MIIGLLGFISSGKGTAGEILEQQGFVPLSFADSLKDATSAIFGWDRALLEGDTVESREFRETVDAFWSNKFGKEITPRFILQYFGTEVCRNTLLDSIWVDSLERKILNYENVVITDVRFNNEINFLKNLGSILVQVDREETRPSWYKQLTTWDGELFEDFAKLNSIHLSEYEWFNNRFVKHKIHNNGTKQELELQLLDIISNN